MKVKKNIFFFFLTLLPFNLFAESSSLLQCTTISPFLESISGLIKAQQLGPEKCEQLLIKVLWQEAIWCFKEEGNTIRGNDIKEKLFQLLTKNSNAKKVDKKLGGSNENYLLEVSPGVFGVFKPDTGNSNSVSEIASYKASELLNLNIVPMTVPFIFEGKKGSLQYFVPDTKSDIGRSFPLSDKQRWNDLMFFDYIIDNTDRHDGNFLIKDNRIIAIDHGLTFRDDTITSIVINNYDSKSEVLNRRFKTQEKTLQRNESYPLSDLSYSLKERLRTISDGEIQRTFEDDLSPSQIESFKSRIRKLKQGDNLSTTMEEVIKEIKESKKQFSLTKELVEKYPPVTREMIDGEAFYFSNLLKCSNHLLTIMYKESSDGKFLPRLVYKSRSDGNFRVTPAVLDVDDPDKRVYSKGKEIHYTQETKLHPILVQFLDSRVIEKSLSSKDEGELKSFFSLSKIEHKSLRESDKLKGKIKTYNSEIQKFNDGGVLKRFQECPPGSCFSSLPQDGSKTFTEYIEKLNRSLSDPKGPLKDFMPNFKESPIEEYYLSHTLLSSKEMNGSDKKDIEVRVYLGKLGDRDVEWHMAQDSKGRTWIDRIRLQNQGGDISSYGSDKWIIDSGFLTNKPLEYKSQVKSLAKESEFQDFNDLYVDITPLLQNLLPIKNFLEAMKSDKGFTKVSKRRGDSDIHTFIINNDVDKLKELLAKNSSLVNLPDREGKTPLHLAIEFNRPSLISLLLASGANPLLLSKENYSPLHQAVLKGSIESLNELLNWGNKVDFKKLINLSGKNGDKVIHLATERGRVDIVELLLKNGANIESLSDGKRTSLHIAAENNQREMIAYLVKKGANTEVKVVVGGLPYLVLSIMAI